MNSTAKSFSRFSDRRLFIQNLLLELLFWGFSIMLVILLYRSIVERKSVIESCIFIILILFERIYTLLVTWPFLFHSSSRVTVSCDGIRCKMINGTNKSASWDQIHCATKCKMIILRQYVDDRFYYVLSEHQLSKDQFENALFCAGEMNTLFVIPYNTKDVEMITLYLNSSGNAGGSG